MDQTTRFDVRLAPLTQAVKAMASPQFVYHDKAANVRAERYDDGAVTLYRREDIIRVNRHPAILGTGGRGGSVGNEAALIPLEIDGDDHKKWRKLLDPLFAPKQIARLEGSVRTLAAELIDGFWVDGEAELHDQFCVPLPCLTFLRLVGVPTDDLDFFIEFKDGVLHPTGDSLEEIDANMSAAAAKLYEYFAKFLATRRADTDPKDDLISDLIRSTVDGEPLSDVDLVNIMFLLMFAGLDTVTSSLSCIFAWLAQHPDERSRLVADKSLIPAAVEEIMRFESPVPAGVRYAQDDIDLGDGLVIRNGEAIHAVWAAANVDPTVYTNPLTVDFGRGRVSHIVFASGTHRCLGSHLARLELRVAVEELLARLPDYSIKEGESLVFDNVGVRVVSHLPITFRAGDRALYPAAG